MTLYIFISSRPVFLFCHSVFWKLNSSVNESRIQFPVKPHALPGLLTVELEHHNKHLLLFYLNVESVKAICHSLAEIEPRTFVSFSLLLNCELFTSLMQGDGCAEMGFAFVQCQCRGGFTRFVDGRLPTKHSLMTDTTGGCPLPKSSSAAVPGEHLAVFCSSAHAMAAFWCWVKPHLVGVLFTQGLSQNPILKCVEHFGMREA